MDNNRQRIAQLLQKYLENRLTAEEYTELWEHMEEDAVDPELSALWTMSGTEQLRIPDAEWNRKMQFLKDRLAAAPVRRRVYMPRYGWAAAAILLLLLSSLGYLYVHKKRDARPAIATVEPAKPAVDRAPGGDKAVLTLAGGRTIVLDSSANGLLASQGNTKIIKQTDGQLIYDAAPAGEGAAALNTLATPRGGQYALTLPDGSKVWLNAASSIKYPTAFTGRERHVEITGEAYFEIAKDESKPFTVTMAAMDVTVLGTRFDVNGYADEETIRTTLLDGKIRIKTPGGERLLQPGSQARIGREGAIKMAGDVDLDEVMAWKLGNFQFDNSDIHSVMRQLARWYDVDVRYEGPVDKHFAGTISRHVPLSQVLNMLEQTGDVRFVIDGKNLTVIPE